MIGRFVQARGFRYAGLGVVLAMIVAVGAQRCGSTEPATSVWRGSTDRRAVALTFDAGSDRGYTTYILNTLKAERIKAAFGLTGVWAQANPDLVRRIVAEGHLLLNHTYDHKSFTGASTGTPALTAAQRTSELTRAEDVVLKVAGAHMSPWFRPPYGDTSTSVLADVGAAGYRWSVMWTVDSLGWKGLTAAAIIDRCAKAAVNGAIYLMHVGKASQDAAALQAMITRFRRSAWSFSRLDELMGV